MNFETLYQREMKAIGDVILAAPWKDKAFYAAWLAQTFYFVKDNTRLLMLCGARMTRENQKLHVRFIEHAGEEKGHEMLLLRDLKNLGYKIEQIPEFPVVAGFYQSQYHWIDYKNPLAFFGYIMVLEGLAVEYGAKIGAMVSEAHGAAATSFLRVHSEEDVDHVEKALAELRALPAEDMAFVVENFKLSIGFYRSMIKECADFAAGAEETKPKAA